jgi:hypothetical protein
LTKEAKKTPHFEKAWCPELSLAAKPGRNNPRRGLFHCATVAQRETTGTPVYKRLEKRPGRLPRELVMELR